MGDTIEDMTHFKRKLEEIAEEYRQNSPMPLLKKLFERRESSYRSQKTRDILLYGVYYEDEDGHRIPPDEVQIHPDKGPTHPDGVAKKLEKEDLRTPQQFVFHHDRKMMGGVEDACDYCCEISCNHIEDPDGDAMAYLHDSFGVKPIPVDRVSGETYTVNTPLMEYRFIRQGDWYARVITQNDSLLTSHFQELKDAVDEARKATEREWGC